MHDLHRLPDDVLIRTEQCTTYLHEVVHEQHHAIDTETAVKHSTLLADVHAAMEDRGLETDTTHGHRSVGRGDTNDDEDDTNGNSDDGVCTGDQA